MFTDESRTRRTFNRALVVLRRSREELQIAHDSPDPFAPLARLGERLAEGRRVVDGSPRRPERLLDEPEVRHDVSERVVDLVRYPRGQRPERGESLGLDERSLELPSLRRQQRPFNRAEESPGLERLWEVSVGVDRGCLRRRVRRDDQHGNGREAGIPLLLDPELPAVHDRHHEIEEDGVGALSGPKMLQRLEPVRAGARVVALVAEKSEERLPNVRVVFDDEDRFR